MDFPTANAFQPQPQDVDGNLTDAFVTALDPPGRPSCSPPYFRIKQAEAKSLDRLDRLAEMLDYEAWIATSA